MEVNIHDTIITLITGDITELSTDAIVNAANSNLQLGGGVAGAIRKKGGSSIQEECDAIGSTPVGTAVITGSGKLPAKHVIHAVGPVMGSGDEDRKLSDATVSALVVAEKNNLRSIAFPAISTGIFGYPKQRCAKVMLSATIAYLKGGSSLDRVIFCLYDPETYNIFEEEFKKLALE